MRPTVVGGRGAKLHARGRPRDPRHEQPRRVQQPRPPASARWSPRSATRPSACVSSPAPGAPSRAPRSRERLLELSGFEGGRVFFTLGGADANENAVKIARQARGQASRPGRHARPLVPRRELPGDGAVRRQPHAQPGRCRKRWACATCRRPMPIAAPSAAATAEECGTRAAAAVADCIDREEARRASPR